MGTNDLPVGVSIMDLSLLIDEVWNAYNEAMSKQCDSLHGDNRWLDVATEIAQGMRHLEEARRLTRGLEE